MRQLPLFIDLKDRSCLVVGGGAVAERKSRILLRAGAFVTIVAPSIAAGTRRLDEKRVTFIERSFSTDLLDGHRLVIAASDSEAVNQAVAGAARRSGTWCNVVDNPALSSFIFPAIVDRSPVVVAIGTSGTAPVLAQRLKTKIEAWLPARVGNLADQAGRWRGLVRKRFPDTRTRLRFWQRFFSGPIAGHLLAGRLREAEHAFRSQIVEPVAVTATERGEAWIVGAGPGDPELITLRGQRLLSTADVVLYDSLVSTRILDYARKDATLLSVGKRAGGPDSQSEINDLLVKLVGEGKRVCRLKGGDPFVFGRGGEEVAALAAANLQFQVVPGISAALGCAASAGIPLTHRGASNSVTLATAVVDKSSDPDWPLLARTGHTLALYMSVRAVGDVTAKLIANGLSESTPAAMVQNGTCSDQRIIEGRLADIARLANSRKLRSPAILFVGETVALRRQPENAEPGNAASFAGDERLRAEWIRPRRRTPAALP